MEIYELIFEAFKIFMKFYLLFLIVLFVVYMFRHLVFTFNRLYGEQKAYYQDIIDSDLPKVSILIPMHNEEKVLNGIIKSLVNTDYPKDKMEIIPINDHSTDKTKEMIDQYASLYSFIKPFHRYSGKRGKQNAINEAIDLATGEIILVYDADYIVYKGQIKDMLRFFIDPEVGAVMGRVIPYNFSANFLTMMLDLERSAGYQVEQQARYNLNLIPQYGGTVGGFRKDVFIKLGKFDPNILAEDTELTIKLYLNGYKVYYANRIEALEEAPEDWKVRARQLRRWSRGHNQVMLKYLIPLIFSKKLNLVQKIDGVLLLLIYTVPFFTLLGFIFSLILFFSGDMVLSTSYLFLISILAFNTFGNFAPFFQIAVASFLDGRIYSIRVLPLFFFSFIFNLFYASLGFIDAILDVLLKRQVIWHKTERFARR